MKILQVIPRFCIGGAEVMCESLLLELAKKGHDVLAVSLFDYESHITENLKKEGIKVICLGKKKGLDLKTISKLSKVIKEYSPNVIHTHLNALRYVGMATIGKKIKIVHTIHSMAYREAGRKLKPLYKHFFKKKVIPVALSEIVEKSVFDFYKFDRSKIKVPIVLNGSNLNKCIVKSDYEIKGDSIDIVHVGRFTDVKNHRGLIEAFNLLHDKYPKCRLSLLGDGELKAEIEKEVLNRQLNNSVEFMGVQSNVYPILSNADIFVLPSKVEGIPITLIEAMGTGLPIVATNVGGIPDMLKNEESALLTDVEPEKIANALERLSRDVGLRKKLGENAKKQAYKFSSEKMAEEYLKIYG